MGRARTERGRPSEPGARSRRIGFGECVLDLDRVELRRGGEVVAIEPRTMDILGVLIEHRNRVVTKIELLDGVWGDRFVSESALTTQIKALRRAIGDTGREQQMIKTVHGRGYMFVAPVHDLHDAAGEGFAIRGERRHGGELGVVEQWNWPRAVGTAADTGPGPDERPVIAVLPFASLSPDGARAHVARGLTNDIVGALSKHRSLRVLTSAATAGLAGVVDPIDRLRGDLDARYGIEGTVRLDDTRLRVTASLTDTAKRECLWADRYDRRYTDMFDVLDEITDVIVATIEPQVGYAERSRVTTRPRTNLRTWDLYHLGMTHFFRFTAADNQEAQRLLARCRELDPHFADPHAWWAYARVLGMVYWDTEPTTDSLDEALAGTSQALRSDDQHAVFHTLHGRVLLARRDYDRALAANQRAIELNPTFAAAFCGLGDSLCYEARYDEAVTQFERAVALGSHDPQRWAFLTYGALALLFAGRHDEAIDWADDASSIPNCQYWTTAHRIVALAESGQPEQAASRVADDLLAQRPGFTVDEARRKLFYLKRSEQIERYLAGLRTAGLPER